MFIYLFQSQVSSLRPKLFTKFFLHSDVEQWQISPTLIWRKLHKPRVEQVRLEQYHTIVVCNLIIQYKEKHTRHNLVICHFSLSQQRKYGGLNYKPAKINGGSKNTIVFLNADLCLNHKSQSNTEDVKAILEYRLEWGGSAKVFHTKLLHTKARFQKK